MARYQLPKSDFIPHPAGSHEGQIYEVEDRGMQETPWGEKHKLSIKVESATATMDDGRPFIISQWYTLSGDPRSALTELRQTLAGRELTDYERENFDDAEILGKQIGYLVVQKKREDGTPRANIQSIWPLKNGQSGQNGQAEKIRPTDADLDHCRHLADLMAEHKLFTDDATYHKSLEIINACQDASKLEVHRKRLVAALENNGVDIPGKPQAVAGSTGNDDLPF